MSEMKQANGCSSPAAAGSMTKLWQNSLLAWVKSYVPSNTAASSLGLCQNSEQDVSLLGKRATHKAENIFLAVSASYTGFGGGFPPGAMAPSPIMFRVLASVQPSGRSSWTATYPSLSDWQACPTLCMIF